MRPFIDEEAMGGGSLGVRLIRGEVAMGGAQMVVVGGDGDNRW